MLLDRKLSRTSKPSRDSIPVQVSLPSRPYLFFLTNLLCDLEGAFQVACLGSQILLVRLWGKVSLLREL